MADIRYRGGQTMSYFSKRALRWTAPVALVGALGLAACGGNDSDEAISINAGPVAHASGLDNHLDIRAKQLARERAEQQLLDRQAGSNEADAAQRAAEAASVRAAEQAERSAHLEGQANTYSGTDVPKVSATGNRAALKAQASSYVDQLQDRAESSCSGQLVSVADAYHGVGVVRCVVADGSSSERSMLPGSHHVPTR
jgi:hypothetical protein